MTKTSPEELFAENMGLVYTGLKAAGVVDITEDDMQDAYLALWKAACGYMEEKGVSFSTYAVMVIRNEIFSREIHAHRKCRAGEEDTLPLGFYDSDGDWKDIDIEYRINLDTKMNIEDFVNYISRRVCPRYREILKMLIDDYSPAEIAEHYGVTRQHICNILYKRIRPLAREALYCLEL